jgi:hypothetical protein
LAGYVAKDLLVELGGIELARVSVSFRAGGTGGENGANAPALMHTDSGGNHMKRTIQVRISKGERQFVAECLDLPVVT